MRAFRPESRRSACRFDITAGPHGKHEVGLFGLKLRYHAHPAA
jgi:hypothetical protein